ncbi:bifunctional 3,4-dihydroxy-2-butanone-4-phosphate synthase/GTP cyclohydrolase II [Corynebacterium aquilae]|uniref:bifunctional 3,4-dihydroxy-2-butanone-4-phosphate synthase/GTP cyclohydrolase II n=1 Tax=Corynebacterium aquilae TaxID=203263 RepID=UPI0009530D54|nr:bifunctional 3,4-dihydroxy-2-butanone-4-phosphate synthase/GTP cyclohydrolase II [Corynebacterium aquilae]
MTTTITNPAANDNEGVRLDSIERAIADIKAGKAIVVIDDEDRENEGDIIFAAEKATPELLAFMVRHSSGYVCASLESADCERLNLPPMVAYNQDARGTAYTVTVDANTGSTGISAASRAETIRRLADPNTTPADFTRPGHVVPLRAVPGGVLRRAGHTEAAVDFARLAGLRPAGVLCEVVGIADPTDMARTPELRQFCDEHDLALVSIAQLIEYRRRTESLVTRVATTRLPTEYGEFTAYGYRAHDGLEHVALVVGDISSNNGQDVLVRVHSECLTGDVFGSRRCDCGQQLDKAMRLVQEAGRGVILYMRGHEGRGIGLMSKLQAYALQDQGADTVDANLALGLPADARDFGTGAQILVDLGIRSINLISNNPTKRAGLSGYGLDITGRTAIPIEVHEDNVNYLRTKRDRMGHELPGLD